MDLIVVPLLSNFSYHFPIHEYGARSKDNAATFAIEERIHLIRAHRVVLAKDLAEVYGVTTYHLNEQVARNNARFPSDFMFHLTIQKGSALRSQSAILKIKGRGMHAKYLPYAFMEHGAVMAATVLNSPVAGEACILLVRAFIRLRERLREQKGSEKKSSG